LDFGSWHFMAIYEAIWNPLVLILIFIHYQGAAAAAAVTAAGWSPVDGICKDMRSPGP